MSYSEESRRLSAGSPKRWEADATMPLIQPAMAFNGNMSTRQAYLKVTFFPGNIAKVGSPEKDSRIKNPKAGMNVRFEILCASCDAAGQKENTCRVTIGSLPTFSADSRTKGGIGWVSRVRRRWTCGQSSTQAQVVRMMNTPVGELEPWNDL